jgi:hypothetical protein
MRLVNISYTKETALEALKIILSNFGDIVYELPNMCVLGISLPTEFDLSVLDNIDGITSFEEESNLTLNVEAATWPWHLLRLVTTSLPLKINYNPINHGDDVVIYLVDSGIKKDHLALNQSRIEDLYTFNEDFNDSIGHGTGLAHLISGKTSGVSKNCIIKNVKIPVGAVTVSKLLEAFEAVLTDHLLTPEKVKVVNCSWTVDKSQLVDAKIMELQKAGLVVVAAAGNDGVAADTRSPVGLNTVIGVGATDVYDRVIRWNFTKSTNFGPEVDLFAPGINIMIANLDNENFGFASGTSLSAAIVSGVVAQYINLYKDFTAQQIQNIVIDNAVQDMLFRNEAIYGTTPNRLISAPYLNSRSIWSEPFNRLFLAKKGEITKILLKNKVPINSAIYDEAVVYDGTNLSGVNFLRKKLPWINSTFSEEGLELIINPDMDIENGKYAIFITSLDVEGVAYYTRYTIGVYEQNESEIDLIETEKYLTENNGETILLVTPEFCYTHGDCGKGGFCCFPYCC